MSREQWGHGYYRGIEDEKQRQEVWDYLLNHLRDEWAWQQRWAENIGFWALVKPKSKFRNFVVWVWSLYYTPWFRRKFR